MKERLLAVIILLFLANCLVVGQDTLSVVSPSGQQMMPDGKKKKKTRTREIVPKKALLYSLVVPGSGQVYSGRWWKLPFVYGALGGVIYAIDYNTSQYRRLRDALNLKRTGDTHEFSNTGIDNEQSLRNLRDQFDKNRQLSYVGLVVVHALQAVEAFVDAHLQNFDSDEDLSLRVRPNFDVTPFGQPSLGVGLIIPVGNVKTPLLSPGPVWSE